MSENVLTNYIQIKEIYPASEEHSLQIDGESIWIGIKKDENSGIILDCKWNHPNPSKDLFQKLDKLTDKIIGTTNFTSF